MKIDLMLLAFIAGSLIPLVTAIITRSTAPSGIKAVISAALAGVVALVSLWTEAAGVVDWKTSLLLFFTTWITHAGAYFGFWKPTGVAPGLHSSTGTFGLG